MVEIRNIAINELSHELEPWSYILCKMKEPNIFLTPDWVKCWNDNYADKYKSNAILVYKNNELKAILPLCMYGKKTIKSLSICSANELYPDHLDIICIENQGEYLNYILKYLKNVYKKWHVLTFAFLSKDGEIASYLRSQKIPFWKMVRNEERAPYIPLGNGIEKHLASFKKKKRYNLNREEKNLDSQGAELFKVTTENELKESLKALFDLHSKRSDAKELISTFSTKEIKRFHHDLANRLLARGWLGLYLLKINGKAVSALYGFKFNKKFYFYQSGLDPEWEKYSVGKILIYKVLKEIDSEGCLEFDFLGGEDPYKIYWTKESREMVTMRLYNRNLIGFCLYCIDTMKMKAKSVLK